MNDLTIRSTSSLQVDNFEQAMTLATIMSQGKLVPAHLQGSPSDCLMVIEQAKRWEMSPFAVAQCTSVIKGKLMYEGKLVAAVVNSRGDLDQKLDYVYSGAGDNRTVEVAARIRGEKDARKISVTFKDARTDNQMWKSQPDQQLMYHGARVWARRHMPELMLGVYVPEEMPAETMRDITPATPVDRPKRQTADPLATASAADATSQQQGLVDYAAAVVGMQPSQQKAVPMPGLGGALSPTQAHPLDLPFIHGNITKSCTSRPAFVSMMEAVLISGTDPDDILECFFANQPTLNDLQAFALERVEKNKTEKGKADAQQFFDRIKAIFDQAHALQKAQTAEVG